MNLGTILPHRGHRRPQAGAGLALAGLAAGAAAVALFEPRSGARRRGLVAQKAIHAGKAARSFGAKAGRDLANRSRGLLASARSSIHEESVPDDVLCDRVRSHIGRLTSHPSAIAVSAREGAIELRGPVLEEEAQRVLEGCRRVHGVHQVVDLLDRHAGPERVPGLQGAPRPPPATELWQERWPPGARLLAMVWGAALAARGLWTRRPAPLAAGAAGALLALRGAANVPLRRLLSGCGSAIRNR
jgi:hypothetical protein